jgi:predicted nuclease of predicted toxin-antitoxin system
VYPGSTHVRDVGLATADDLSVWKQAGRDGLVIASKDADFHQLSFTLGPPPKAVWLRVGNCPTSRVAELLRRHAEDVGAFARSDAAFLALG